MAMLTFLLVVLAACSSSPASEAEVQSDVAEETATIDQATEGDAASTLEQTGAASGFPLTIENCDYTVTFEEPPQRVVVNDVNILELFLALDLQEHMVGYSSVRDDKEIAPEYQEQLTDIPLLAERYPSIEVLAGASPDLYLAGWNYGMTEDSGLTPETLAPLGINTYAITESCIRVMDREQVSLEDTFTDLINLGRIFAVEERAQALVEQYRAELAEITETIGTVDEPLRVFVYDSGEDTPLTAARFATPNAMIEAAGGTNIFNDVDSSWTQVNWEDVVDRNPEYIVIIDYGQPNAQGKIDFLKAQPELADVDAIQNNHFVVLTYAEATPGPRNVARTRTLAEAFYPEKFQGSDSADTANIATATEYPLTIENCETTITYDEPPTRIVSMNDDSTLVLLGLGLQDKIAGIGYATSAAIPSEYDAAYNELNVLAEGSYPALEEIVAVEPDFIYASLRSAYEDEAAGDRESLEDFGINTYLGMEYCQEDNEVTIDTIYDDIRNIGQIFDVSEQAETLIASMQSEIAEVQQQIESVEQPLQVFFYDSGEESPFTAGGSGMAGELIELAGGANIFDDIADEYGETNWELVVERNPEFIVIADYGTTTAEEKRNFLLNYAPLRDVTAIQGERFVTVPLRHLIAGLNNPKAVRTMAEAFYPDEFGSTGIPMLASTNIQPSGPYSP